VSTQPTAKTSTGMEISGQPGTHWHSGKLLATQGYVIGIEIGSSGVRQSVALADLNGAILHRVRRPQTHIPDTQTVLQLLDEMLTEVIPPDNGDGKRILRIGIAVGGLVDAKRGMIKRLHHAQGWQNFPLQDYFAEKLNVPCIVDNNANAAALAEVTYGVGKGQPVVLYVGLGQGIGGGLVANGHIYHGVTGTAGEIGHLLVKDTGPECSCGSVGHLEAVASANAMIRAVLRLARECPETETAIHRITEGQVENLTVEQIFRLAAEGNQPASYVVKEVCMYLGNTLANIVHLINPSMIILGGQVAQAGDYLLNPLRERVQELCLPEACQSLRIEQSTLGNEASLVGAVTLALQDI